MNKKHLVLILNVIVILQVRLTVSKNKNPNCALGGGSPEEAQPRIVGGYEVQDMSKFGYQAQYGDCAGAILGPNWVASAAHCSKKAVVRVGSKIRHEGTLYIIADYYYHPIWDDAKKPHPNELDIVLLKLKKPLVYNANVYAIKIGKVEQLSVGLMLTISGWGYTKFNGSMSRVLRAVDLPVVAQSICKKVPQEKYSILTDNMFCTGFKKGLKDTCKGDSGAPAVSNKRLFGLVSFGYNCALPNIYGVLTKIGKVIPWIQKIT